jgi:hypothetical protein
MIHGQQNVKSWNYLFLRYTVIYTVLSALLYSALCYYKSRRWLSTFRRNLLSPSTFELETTDFSETFVITCHNLGYHNVISSPSAKSGIVHSGRPLTLHDRGLEFCSHRDLRSMLLPNSSCAEYTKIIFKRMAVMSEVADPLRLNYSPIILKL